MGEGSGGQRIRRVLACGLGAANQALQTIQFAARQTAQAHRATTPCSCAVSLAVRPEWWPDPRDKSWPDSSAMAVTLALGSIGLALLLPWKPSLVALICLGFCCLMVIAGVRLRAVGVGSIALFCLTASWDQVTVGGIEYRMLFLFLGLLLLAPTLDLRRLPPVPWWLHAYGLSAVVVTCSRPRCRSPMGTWTGDT